MLKKETIKQKKSNVIINMISTLPPNGGISDYTSSLLKIIDSNTDFRICFWDFKSLYPPFIIKKVIDNKGVPNFSKKIKVNRVLSWWNIIVPIIIPFTFRGSIVHLQYWSPATIHIYFLISLISRLIKKKIIITIHNPSPHEKTWTLIKTKKPEENIVNISISKIIKLMDALFIKLGNHYIVHTKNSLDKLVGKYSINPNKITLINHPIIDIYSRGNFKSSEAKKALKLPPDKTILLFFGNIRKYKGIEDILNLFQKLNKKKYYLLIAGRAWGSIKEQVEKKLKLFSAGSYKYLDGYISAEMVEPIFIASDILLIAHKKFYSASGVINLAIYYNTKVIASQVFQNQPGIELITSDISTVSEKRIEAVLAQETDKTKLVEKINQKIGSNYKDFILDNLESASKGS